MRGSYADRLGEEAAHERALHDDRVRAMTPWPFDYVRAELAGKEVRGAILASTLWHDVPVVSVPWEDGEREALPERSARLRDSALHPGHRQATSGEREALVAAMRAFVEEQRTADEREQTDARAVAWLKERGRLVEQEDGRWVLMPTT